jgi:hypothetical protein
VPLVFGLLFGRFKVKILFAHRTFPWESEARGKAHVHVVIIGFACSDTLSKRLYDYDSDQEHPTITEVRNISPYLTPGPDLFVTKRQKPLCLVPDTRCGNKPTDDGNLILTDAEKEQFLAEEPGARKFLRRFTGSEEFINGNMRWCLWLVGADPSELRSLPRVRERIERVRDFRLKSTAEPTRKAAETPAVFFYVSQPSTDYILIPEVSSERRKYIPIGLVSKNVISANTNFLVPDKSLYLLGVLTSTMHMAWVRQVGGRLKSDYRYSGSMVYNTFPWPQSPTAKQKEAVESAAQKVLDVRAQFMGANAALGVPALAGQPRETSSDPECSSARRPPEGGTPNATLADLYDPLSMPPALVKAHAELDRAVDWCYRPQPFTSERQRVEYLFGLYEQLTAPLLPATKPKRPRKRVSA